jgi:hypothetical protein
MRREFAEGLCLDPASVLIADAPPSRRQTVIGGVERDIRRLTDDQLQAVARLVAAIAGTEGPGDG